MGALKIKRAGALSTIQDQGRFGFRQFGIPQSGAMDLQAMHNANFLVGNDPGWPVIETAMQGLEFEATKKTIIGICGAQVSVNINGQSVQMNQSFALKEGDIVVISAPQKGVYSYLAIAGKIKATEDFGSTSTYLLAGFGGIDGRALKAGDLLESSGESKFENRSAKDTDDSAEEIKTIRMIKGPEWKLLKDLPDRMTFQINPSSNRMGVRLEGSALAVDGKEIVSSAVIPGTVQLPFNGLPIVLMNDCQTTGGYPRIGKVIDADLGKLAQLRAGQKLKFETVEL